ncbi:S41 family peptidase, partial [Treponema sp. R6D11]
MKKSKLISIILLTAVLSSGLTYYFSRGTSNYALVDRARTMLEEKYYEKIDDKKAVEGMLYGLAGSMGDPYTSYLTEKEYEYFEQIVSGTYSGLGISISGNDDDNYITIVTTVANTPAGDAGLKTGDNGIKFLFI